MNHILAGHAAYCTFVVSNRADTDQVGISSRLLGMISNLSLLVLSLDQERQPGLLTCPATDCKC